MSSKKYRPQTKSSNHNSFLIQNSWIPNSYRVNKIGDIAQNGIVQNEDKENMKDVKLESRIATLTTEPQLDNKKSEAIIGKK